MKVSYQGDCAYGSADNIKCVGISPSRMSNFPFWAYLRRTINLFKFDNKVQKLLGCDKDAAFRTFLRGTKQLESNIFRILSLLRGRRGGHPLCSLSSAHGLCTPQISFKTANTTEILLSQNFCTPGRFGHCSRGASLHALYFAGKIFPTLLSLLPAAPSP